MTVSNSTMEEFKTHVQQLNVSTPSSGPLWRHSSVVIVIWRHNRTVLMVRWRHVGAAILLRYRHNSAVLMVVWRHNRAVHLVIWRHSKAVLMVIWRHNSAVLMILRDKWGIVYGDMTARPSNERWPTSETKIIADKRNKKMLIDFLLEWWKCWLKNVRW